MIPFYFIEEEKLLHMFVYILYKKQEKNNLRSGEKHSELFLYSSVYCLKHCNNHSCPVMVFKIDKV